MRTEERVTMSEQNSRDEVYFAVDLRADGPVPGLCSTQRLQLTLVGAGRNGRIVALEPHLRETFSIEMRPIGVMAAHATSSWLQSEVARLANAVPAGEATVAAAGWIRDRIATAQAVPITWPGGIEGVHLYHYFTWRGDGSNPFTSSAWANNTQLIAQLLGEDTSLISGVRSSNIAEVAPSAKPVSKLAGAKAMAFLGAISSVRG